MTGRRRRASQCQGDHTSSNLRAQRWNGDRRVLSRQRPAAPSSRKRSCQRQITVLAFPVACMISAVPQPSAVRRTIFARQTCFCGLWRLETTASSLLRSAAFNRIFVRSCIPQTRTREAFRESPSESKHQICSTSARPILKTPRTGRAFHNRDRNVDGGDQCPALFADTTGSSLVANVTPLSIAAIRASGLLYTPFIKLLF